MVTLLVNALIVLALTAAIGWSVFTFQRSAEIVSLSQRNAARMEQVASTFRASLRPVEMAGALRSPLGDPQGPPVQVARDSGGRAVNPAEQVCIDEQSATTHSAQYNVTCRSMGLPAWVVTDTRTPWGAQYAYCPYSVNAVGDAPAPGLTPQATQGIVRSGSSAAYPVEVVVARGRNFVWQSGQGNIRVIEGGIEKATTAAAESLVGLILSPAPFQTAAPVCSDVAKVDGSWLVVGPGGGKPSVAGSVVAVVSTGLGAGQGASEGEVSLFVGPSGTGAGTGADPANAMAFKDALDAWHLTPWRSTTIHMAAGSYGFSQSDIVPGTSVSRLAFASAAPGRTIRLVADSGQASIVSAAGALDLTLAVDASFENVSLSGGLGLVVGATSRARVTGGGLGYVMLDGGDLTLSTGTSVRYDPARGTQNAVDVAFGRLILAGGGFSLDGTSMPAGGVGINALGGTIQVDGTDIAMQLPGGTSSMALAPEARLSITPVMPQSGPARNPSLSVNGSGQALDAGGLYTVGCNADGSDGSGVCEAHCPAMTAAQSGSCSHDPVNGQPPALSVSGNAGSARTWSCQWNPGVNYVMGPNGVASATPVAYPPLKASAQCRPSPVVGVPMPG